MNFGPWFRRGVALLLAEALLLAQQVPAPPPGMPPGFTSPMITRPATPQQPASQPAAAPAQNGPASSAAAASQPPARTGTPTIYGGLSLNNASLSEVIDLLARQLHINYILDPRVKGGVILNTYGDTKDIDSRSLLETILRINGYGMVKQGDLFRIVPLSDVSHLPLAVEQVSDASSIPEDDRTMLNLVFLKYITADELAKVLEPFEGENARMYTYGPANLLFVLDSRRNMRRLMDLISLFDSDSLANQRVRLFETKHGRPTDIAKELETLVKAISLSDKTSPIKFIPVDRINGIVAISANPGAFKEVETWLEKLDVPAKVTSGAITNYVYRVRYADAQVLGCAIQALYSTASPMNMFGSSPLMACMAMSGQSTLPGVGTSMSSVSGGSFGSAFSTNAGAYGGAGMYGGNPYAGGANMYGGGNMYGGNAYGAAQSYAAPMFGAINPASAAAAASGQAAAGAPAQGATPFSSSDMTGTYMGANNFAPNNMQMMHVPRVVANPFNNTLMIQGTPQEYESIIGLLKDLDVPPRQVLIEAKFFEVDLDYAIDIANSLNLQNAGATATRALSIGNNTGGLAFSQGWLVGMSRQLLTAVTAGESRNKTRIIQDPKIIATDSIPASINSGTEVPVLTSQAVSGVTEGGTNLFANTTSYRNTGVTLNVTARINPSGIVTLILDEEYSTAGPPGTGVSSPTFPKKAIQTQVTVQDGDTVAIGGIIDDESGLSTSGLPILSRIPWLGAIFGERKTSKTRQELMIFLTPHVIFDSNQLVDAADEIRKGMHSVTKIMKE